MTRQPVLFAGHGSPLNAVEDNAWSRALRGLGAGLPRPRAVLAVSAHWHARGAGVTADREPATLHDFAGFPAELHGFRYPAPGDPELAAEASSLLGGAPPVEGRGLDHGVWGVLCLLFPDAGVPVVQLGLDAARDDAGHLAAGRALAPLRNRGVLIVASGNVTHNLRDAFGRRRDAVAGTPDWAVRFDAAAAAAVAAHDHAALLALHPHGPDARLAHPTPEHWLPLLYAAGAADSADPVSFPITGFDWGSLSMRSILWG